VWLRLLQQMAGGGATGGGGGFDECEYGHGDEERVSNFARSAFLCRVFLANVRFGKTTVSL